MACDDIGKKSVSDVFDRELMDPLFAALESTRGVIQMEVHHPEGDVFTHSLQVLKWAFRETDDTDLIIAAMLHDVGKVENSKGHEKIALNMIGQHVSAKTAWLIENHMRIWHLILGDMKKLSKIHNLANHPWLSDLIMLARWDKLGRNPNAKISYNYNEIISRLNGCVRSRFDLNRTKSFYKDTGNKQ